MPILWRAESNGLCGGARGREGRKPQAAPPWGRAGGCSCRYLGRRMAGGARRRGGGKGLAMPPSPVGQGRGAAARGGSGSGGRQKNSGKSSAGRLATGPRIAYLCSRGEEAAMARPAPATKKAPMPHAPRRPAGRGGHGGRTINPTTRSYASRKTLRRAEGEE